MKTIAERQAQVIEEFSKLSNWGERYKLLIQKGKALPDLPEDKKTADALVKGCQSQVWLHASLDENKNMVLQADSDALLVKGIVALLLEVFSPASPKEILSSDVKFIEQIGLGEHLTPSRANGLMAMIKQIKYFATAFALLESRGL